MSCCLSNICSWDCAGGENKPLGTMGGHAEGFWKLRQLEAVARPCKDSRGTFLSLSDPGGPVLGTLGSISSHSHMLVLLEREISISTCIVCLLGG